MFVKNCYQLKVKYSALRLVKFQVLCTTQWSRRPTDGQTDKGIRDFGRFTRTVSLSLTCTVVPVRILRQRSLIAKSDAW